MMRRDFRNGLKIIRSHGEKKRSQIMICADTGKLSKKEIQKPSEELIYIFLIRIRLHITSVFLTSQSMLLRMLRTGSKSLIDTSLLIKAGK